ALLRLYRSADAVVTYGPHVSSYVQARGARRVHIAPQAVDNAFWASPDVSLPSDPRWPAGTGVKFLFAGRPAREKGLGVLVEAWSTSGLQAPTAALVLVGAGSTPPWVPPGGAVVGLEAVSQAELRNLYGAADVLVLPSIPTRTFREPWGLVANEAMNRGLPVIASDAVGAAAGGLVRDARNGLVVPAGDAVALAAALRRLARDPALRARPRARTWAPTATTPGRRASPARLATSACQGDGEVALGLLEGLLGNLKRGGAYARGTRRLARPAGGSARRGVPVRRTLLPTVLLVALALLSGPMPAQASEASQIIEKCAHGQPISGYRQSAYRQALKQLPTILIEYSPCTEQIRGAELAAAGGGAGGTSTGAAPNVPLALTPKEQRAIQSAHHSG